MIYFSHFHDGTSFILQLRVLVGWFGFLWAWVFLFVLCCIELL